MKPSKMVPYIGHLLSTLGGGGGDRGRKNVLLVSRGFTVGEGKRWLGGFPIEGEGEGVWHLLFFEKLGHQRELMNNLSTTHCAISLLRRSNSNYTTVI